MIVRRVIVSIVCAITASAALADDGWQTSIDGNLYGYATHSSLDEHTPLNRGNRVAQLAERGRIAEWRLNMKAESTDWRLTARPILHSETVHNAFADGHADDAYLSQWQIRYRLNAQWHLAAGRDVLNWGPAQFRSPSSPFYFDNGRSDPLAEIGGVDTLKLSWTPDIRRSITVARIVDGGHLPRDPDPTRDSWLLKAEQRDDAAAYGIVVHKAPKYPTFFGAFAQATLSDAILIYAEASSATLAHTLVATDSVTQPFAVTDHSPRQTTALVGTSYTFENGQSMALEVLQNGHGYSAAQESTYFGLVVQAPGLLLGYAPPLLGRDYLHAVWQSNTMDEQGFWRLMASHNLTDHSSELAFYGERVLSSRITAFVMAMATTGTRHSEWGAGLLDNRVSLGVKIALP